MAGRNSAFRFLINRYFFLSLFFLIIQQLIVASSTYWIGGLAEQVGSNENFTLYLVFFVLSLIIVYIPSFFSAIFLEKSKFIALEKYIDIFRRNFWNKASIRTNKNYKDLHLPYVSTEGFLVFEESFKFIFDWISVILNVSFSVLVLALVVNVSIVWPYIISLCLICVNVFLFRKKIQDEGAHSQTSRTALQRVLSLSWDNILLGNKYNLLLYQRELQVRQILASESAIHCQYWSNIASTLGMLLTMAPVFIWSGVLFYKNIAVPSILAVLVATLPRQIMILQHAYIAIFYTTSWSALKARLLGLGKSAEIPVISQKIEDRIQWELFECETTGALSEGVNLQHMNSASMPLSGRITIRGPNGAGKSSYLCWLKEQIGDCAYYLPAHHELIFKNTLSKNLSTGQAAQEYLEELSQVAAIEIKILMLDEWDANLDLSSRTRLNNLIDKLSQSILIVEVRHGY
ncbi:ATP-binding cassette domain-containing protein [Acerihabitans arboris]|uniref:Uncharacterized protein n=1 Tax=Acerihabitans arboris TaxID=2691583 RepID=A0A845SI09_9GAMM|nr:ABC transporter ATP-binding protein [Acerihabitans arboris]NDL63012.1 hypothetical protein [Acerihabitans arboris]